MFEEVANKIGAIIALIFGAATVITLVGCIVSSLISVIKERKEKREVKDKVRKEYKRGDIWKLDREYLKLKGIDCQETDEKKEQLYEVMQNFREFCKKYDLEFDVENFKWYAENQLSCYKYKEEEK